MLDRDDERRLLAVARYALEARVRGGPPPHPDRGGALDRPAAVFVTLRCRGELRGCLGQLERDAPLGVAVARLAALVADSDPRFEPVTPPELAEVVIEVSVLTPEQEVASYEDVEIGRHGLIVEQDGRRGLLLPQVPLEHGWDEEEFLDHACRKAGLPPGAWRRGARLLVFEAHAFGEEEQV